MPRAGYRRARVGSERQATGASSRAATVVHDQRATTARRAAARAPPGRLGGSASSSLELRPQVVDVAGLERGEVAQPRRVLRLEPGRDLGEARVARDERRAAGRGGLGGDHPERLREDRRHDRDVGERQQVDEMAVLERPGEERLPGGQRARLLSSSRAVVAEADDHGARVEPAHRLEQQVDALVVDQLPEVDDDRAVARRRTPRAARRCPRPAAARSRCRGSAGRARLLDAAPASASSRGSGTNSSTSTPGGTSCTRLDVADDLLEHLADVRRADERRLRAARAPPRPTPRARGRPRIEYSSSEPCALTAERQPARGADRRAQQHVVREDEVGGQRARAARPRSPRRSASRSSVA